MVLFYKQKQLAFLLYVHMYVCIDKQHINANDCWFPFDMGVTNTNVCNVLVSRERPLSYDDIDENGW